MLSNSSWRRKKCLKSSNKSIAPSSSYAAASYSGACAHASSVDPEFAQWFTWCILSTLRQFVLKTVIAELAGHRHPETTRYTTTTSAPEQDYHHS